MSRSFASFAVLLLFLAPATVFGQQPPRVDPGLRELLRPEVRATLDRVERFDVRSPGATVRPAGAIAVTPGPDGEPRVDVLVRLREPHATALSELRAAGAEIGTVVGGIATARVPLPGLERLTRSLHLETLEAARTVEVFHDSSMSAIRVDEVRQVASDGSWKGLAGDGVLVGVYDTGLDYDHDDFLNPDGTPRVLGLWDQTGNGTPPTGYTYGHYCDGASLADGSCLQEDTNGHGTHVAGSAAGDGSAVGSGGTAYQYAGVAPAADLLIVKGGDGQFSTADIVDGVAWIFAEADRLGQPAVANLSLGTNSGPHDGTSLFEEALDNLSAPGRIIVTSAGNSGSNGNTTPAVEDHFIHASAVPSTGSKHTFTVEVPAYTATAGKCNDVAEMELWYDGRDTLSVIVRRPDGTGSSVGYNLQVTDTNPDGEIYVDNALGGPTYNGDNQAYIKISDCNESGTPAEGTWTVEVRGTAVHSGEPAHLWITYSSLGNEPARGRNGFDNRYIVGVPGTADSVLTVGAFVTRLCWPTRSDRVCFTEQEAMGDLARFSSGGPSRDGRMKPEITAPGMAIVSALSSSAAAPELRTTPDGVHWAIQGTSMAAPHVTGAVALMLQVDPTLTAARIRDIFSRTARQDLFTSRTYSTDPDSRPEDWWGYGKLDVKAALEDMGAFEPGVARLELTPATDTLPVNATLELRADAFNAHGMILSNTAVTWSSGDPTVATVDADGVVTAASLGSTIIVGTAEGKSDTASVHVVPPATLVLDAEPLAPPSSPLSTEGTRLPLLHLTLYADGHEAVRVDTLGFRLRGADEGARLLLIRDENNDGLPEQDEPVVASLETPLAGEATEVAVTPDSFTVAAHDSVRVFVTLELSGAVPNGAAFQAEFLPRRTRSTGVRSRTRDRLSQPETVVASATTETTVLKADEIFAMSENPVRSSRVVFNFSEPPEVAAVYTLGGRRVRDLVPLLSVNGRRIEWDLTNADGGAVAPGVYLVVFDVDGELIRKKLIVVRPASAGGEE